MADNVMDYQTQLADMESKKALLEQAIIALRAALAAGALGTPGDLPAGSNMILSVGPSVGDIPKGAFFGKSIPEAIVGYLQAVRKRCPTNEVVQGLQKGGIVSTSKTFNIVVGSTLRRLRSEGKLLLFDDGWGLPEWVPENLRSRVEEKNKVQPNKKRGPKKKKTKAKVKVTPEKAAKPTEISEAPRPKALVEKYFATHQGAEVSPKELAKTLNLNAGSVNFILTQMARKGSLEKTTKGKFLSSSKITPISKAV